MRGPRSVGDKDLAGSGAVSRAPRAKHLEDEETSRDLFGVVRGACAHPGCECRQYVKLTSEYTVQPDEVGQRLHPHNDVGIMRCSCCGHAAEDHLVDGAMNEKEHGNDSFAIGRYDEAILSYTRAIAQKPHDEALWSNRAAAYLCKGMYDQALHDASRAVEISPSWAKARARKAGALFKLKRYESAAKEYRVCVKLDPKSAEYAHALAQAQAAAKKPASQSAPPPKVARDHKRLGDEDMRSGRYARAIERYTEAIRSDPKDPKVFSNRSAAHAGGHMYQKALQDATAATDLAPNWAKAWNRKGFALYHLGRLGEALACYQECLRLDPSDKAMAALVEQMKNIGSDGRDQTVQEKGAQTAGQDSMKSSVEGSLRVLRELMTSFALQMSKQSTDISSILARLTQIEVAISADEDRGGNVPGKSDIESRHVVGGSHSPSSSFSSLSGRSDHSTSAALQEELIKERTLRQVAEVAAEEDQEFLRDQVETILREKASMAQENARLTREARAMAKQLEILGAQVNHIHQSHPVSSTSSSRARARERKSQKEKATRMVTKERLATMAAAQKSPSSHQHQEKVQEPKAPEIDASHANIDAASISSENTSEDYVKVKADDVEAMDSPSACGSEGDQEPNDGSEGRRVEEAEDAEGHGGTEGGDKSETSSSPEDPSTSSDTSREENVEDDERVIEGDGLAKSEEGEDPLSSAPPKQPLQSQSSVKVSADNLLSIFQSGGEEMPATSSEPLTQSGPSDEKPRENGGKTGSGLGAQAQQQSLLEASAKNMKGDFQKRVEEEFGKIMAQGGIDPQEAAVLALSAAKETLEDQRDEASHPSGQRGSTDKSKEGLPYFNQNAKEDACKVFQDVWDALESDHSSEEDDHENGEECESRDQGQDEEDKKWFDLQEEWKRVQDFCAANRDVIKPPFREKRPLHETAKPILVDPKKSGSQDAEILDITNISENMKAISSTSFKRDWFGVVRGPCKRCSDGFCKSFQPSYQGCQTPQALFERAMLEGDNAMMDFALKWPTLPPGKHCAQCGCPAQCHETEEEHAKKLRLEAILRKKQEDVELSRKSKLREEEDKRCKRIKDAVMRQRQAEASGEYIRETCLDFITQIRRGPNPNCSDCPGFKVIYREADALNPEVMLYCSLCGHPSNDHPIDKDWVNEQKRKQERERARYPPRGGTRFGASASTGRPRFGAQRYSNPREDQAKQSACRILGVPATATKHQISRAYKKMALKYHPDKNPSSTAQEIFVKLTHAFQVLNTS